jgi:hypothetical protein
MIWLALCLLALLPCHARAGAWTQEEGRWQVISGVILSDAGRGYDSDLPIRFRRTLLQAFAEYGLSAETTLFATAESAIVDIRQGGAPRFHASDNAIEGGARWRFDPWAGLSALGVFSLDVSARTAGAFNFAVSADRHTGGSGAQARLLYGRGFKLWERDAFVDLEAGGRLLSGARPLEVPLDLTAGIWLDPGDMVMVQSFNLSAGAGRAAAYPAFASHKLQFSWVRRLSDRFLVQAGAFFSPAGHNALVEQGACLSLWSRF